MPKKAKDGQFFLPLYVKPLKTPLQFTREGFLDGKKVKKVHGRRSSKTPRS